MTIPHAAVVDDKILTGGEPSASQLDDLQANGFTDIVCVKTDGELAANFESNVEARGMRYHKLPVGGPDDLTPEKAESLDAILAECDGKVCVFCGSGNRVGALFALREFHINNAPADAALQYGLAAGMKGLAPFIQMKLNA